MMPYSVQPRKRTSVKGYGFLSFAKNMCKTIGKNISKNLSDKSIQKLLDHTKQSAVSKKAIQKTAEATGDLIGNEIADRITKVSKKTLPQKYSETVTNEDGKEIPKERYISPEGRQKIIDDLTLI